MPIKARLVLAACIVAVGARPQSASESSTITSSASLETAAPTTSDAVSYDLASISTLTDYTVSVPTGPYLSYTSQIVLTTSGNATNTAANATATSESSSLLLTGTIQATTTVANGTRTATSSAPTNTQKCNGYVEFCDRQYMNVTEVCAHNSAFFVKNNLASNQLYDITAQLDDGVRMIQGETHWVNDTIYSCHTSCDLLNAGTLENELSTVASWVEQHPYDIVTILLVNSDYRNVTDYVNPIQNSGLAPYLYEPPKIPMRRTDWPTYAEMIISAKRVVIFMDYQADQTTVPYVLDEFSQMWETPFSPTNASFPCTQQRPPDLSAEDAADMPYIANHNLNLAISLSSVSLLIPAYPNLTTENAVSGPASAGEMMDTCVQEWGRPPSWLLVDYYNYGDYPGSGRPSNNSGSVFEVAAQLNGVNYTGACCGPADGNAATSVRPVASVVAAIAAAAGLLLLL